MHHVDPLPVRGVATSPHFAASGRAWATIAVFAVTAILSYTDRQILSVLVDPIRAELKISDTQVSLLQGLAFALIYSFAGIPLGSMADRTSRKSIIVVGILLWSAATVYCGYARGFGDLFAARVLVGVGEAALAPAVMSMIADLFPPERRGAATGLFMMGMVIGSGSAIAVAGAVLAMAQARAFAGWPGLAGLSAWRVPLVLLGSPGVVIALIIACLREPKRQNMLRVGNVDISYATGLLLANRRLLTPIYIALAMQAVGDFSLFNWGPALLSRRFSMGPGEVGAALGSISALTGILGTAAGGLASDRWVRHWGTEGRLRVALGSAITGVIGTLCAFAQDGSQVLAIFALWLLTSAAGGTVGVTLLQEAVPNEIRGLAIALVSLLNVSIGLAFGTFLTAFLTDHLFGDPTAVGMSITMVTFPAGVMAAFFYWRAWETVRANVPSETQ